MQLSEQEIVRREALEQIKALGIDPFPADMFEVNFKTTDFISSDFHGRLVKEIEQLKSIGPAKAEELANYLKANKFKADKLIADTETMTSLGLSEQASFDEGVEKSDMPLADFIGTLRTAPFQEFGKEQRPSIKIAGRFMGQRGPFAKLQDSEGKMQLYMKKGTIGADENEQALTDSLVKLLHIGDFIGVEGFLFSTQTGEVTLHVEKLTFLGKSLKNLPIVKTDKEGNVHDAFTDPELRYRQRYVDLVVNPQVKEAFVKRTKMYNSI